MLLYRNLFLFSFLFFVCIGCTSIVNLHTYNNTNDDIMLEVTSLKKSKEVEKSSGYIVKKDSKDKVFTLEVPKGGSLELKYHTLNSKAYRYLDPYNVPDGSGPHNTNVILTMDDSKTWEDQKEALLNIAKELNFTKDTKHSNLFDIRKGLGMLIIGYQDNDKLFKLDYIPFLKDQYHWTPPTKISETITIETNTLTDAELDIPIYMDFKAALTSSKLYEVSYSISKNDYQNNIDVGYQIMNMSNNEKQRILSALSLYEDKKYYIYVLRKFDFIENAVFNYIEGEKVDTETDISLISSIKSGYAYKFDSRKMKIIDIPGIAYNYEYRKMFNVLDLKEKLAKSLYGEHYVSQKKDEKIVIPTITAKPDNWDEIKFPEPSTDQIENFKSSIKSSLIETSVIPGEVVEVKIP